MPTSVVVSNFVASYFNLIGVLLAILFGVVAFEFFLITIVWHRNARTAESLKKTRASAIAADFTLVHGIEELEYRVKHNAEGGLALVQAARGMQEEIEELNDTVEALQDELFAEDEQPVSPDPQPSSYPGEAYEPSAAFTRGAAFGSQFEGGTQVQEPTTYAVPA